MNEAMMAICKRVDGIEAFLRDIGYAPSGDGSGMVSAEHAKRMAATVVERDAQGRPTVIIDGNKTMRAGAGCFLAEPREGGAA